MARSFRNRQPKAKIAPLPHDRWVAVAHPGLEPVVANEIASYGISSHLEPGAVVFHADIADASSLARRVRTASRLLWIVGIGPAKSLEQLAQTVRACDWTPVLARGMTCEVHVSTRESRLRRREAISKKVTHALQDVIRQIPASTKSRQFATQRVHVRLVGDQVTLSVDAGGEPLHRRGWRKSVGDAPLRENLAACMLFAAGWTGDEPLLDPFCGSGTLPIEATLLASGVNPGAHRRYTCDQWPASDGKIHTPIRNAISVPIIGADRDPNALEAAKQNAQRAKVEVLWRCTEVQHLEAPNGPPGLIVTNPPYGKRLGNRSEDSVHDLYDQFAITLQERFKGWRVSFLAPHRSLAARLHPQVQQLTSFSNGGLRVGLWIIDLV